jgi:hypothetical protein
MKHISQQMLTMDVRRPHLDSYRKSLRASLSRSDLSVEEMNRLRRELRDLGRPKVYAAQEPPAWGIDSGPMPEAPLDLDHVTADDLLAFPHQRLRRVADRHAVVLEPGDTKALIIQKILAAKGKKPCETRS